MIYAGSDKLRPGREFELLSEPGGGRRADSAPPGESEAPSAERRYHVVTLGCKLNRFDSAQAEGVLRAAGYAPSADPRRASVILLNTCTVTARADADGRRWARRLRRLNPAARIVATGCYAERDAEALGRLGVLDEIVGLRERRRLPSALLGHDECTTGSIALFFGDRSRAFLRIQEGCDLGCSYCVIPQVRGTSRSVPAGEVLAQLERLAATGVREVGLTGVNTGSWGRDLEPRRALADLLAEILDRDLPLRIRLNSLEPKTVTRRVLALMAQASDRLVPHVQVPLQSGSDRVLAAMSRNYRTKFYRELIERIVASVPDICVGADVICGFPGESAADHAATLAFIDSLPLAYLHVFSYSPRPGTRAAARGDALVPARARARTRELRAVGERHARAFRQAMIGRTLDALTLDALAADGSRRALTGNYIEVHVRDLPQGQLWPVRLTALADEGLAVRAELAS
ncbi:MAG: MiaB/RimO family radical SAM methylthiotransferase [Acidobacteriota bacterium]|nr:MAG: MiaB/RimO family radical SAM methylthiotransferase [Acidobacteriota bacterium]